LKLQKCNSEESKGVEVHRYQMYKSFLKVIDLQVENTLAEVKNAEESVRKKGILKRIYKEKPCNPLRICNLRNTKWNMKKKSKNNR